MCQFDSSYNRILSYVCLNVFNRIYSSAIDGVECIQYNELYSNWTSMIVYAVGDMVENPNYYPTYYYQTTRKSFISIAREYPETNKNNKAAFPQIIINFFPLLCSRQWNVLYNTMCMNYCNPFC